MFGHGSVCVTYSCPGSVVIAPCAADSPAIQQVFLNLIGNSIKFAPDGGIVEIEVDTRSGTAVVRSAQWNY